MSFSDVHLVWAGKFTSREEWLHPEAALETTEIIIVTEGTVYMEEGSQRFVLHPNSVLFLRPALLHRGFFPSSERVSFYWLHIRNFSVEDHMLGQNFVLREPGRISMLCRQLLDYMSDGFGEDVRDRLTYVLLAELMRQQAGADSDGTPAYRIREWIRINSDRPLSVAETARQFNYNEDYISRLMKKSCGCSLKTLIVRLRMDYLRLLLSETSLTLAETADRAGFSDYKQFLKYFTYHEGCTPSEFRRTYCSIHTNNR